MLINGAQKRSIITYSSSVLLLASTYLLVAIFSSRQTYIPMPHFIAITSYIIGLISPLPFIIIYLFGILYDSLISGNIGTEALPISICYYLLLAMPILQGKKNRIAAIWAIFFIYLASYEGLKLLVLYLFFSFPHASALKLLIAQFCVTLFIYPFLHLLIAHCYRKL